MVARMTKKETKVEVLDLGKNFSYLMSLGKDQEYLTPQGVGLMEGMILTNPEVEVVSVEAQVESRERLIADYKKIINSYEDTQIHICQENDNLKVRNKELYGKLHWWQK